MTFTSDEPAGWNVVVNYRTKRPGLKHTSWFFEDRDQAFAKAEEILHGDEETFIEVYKPHTLVSVEVVEERVHARWTLTNNGKETT